MILRIAADREPRAIVVCFGAEAAAYRVELYPDYHATRPPVPDAAGLAVRAGAGVLRRLRLETRSPTRGSRPTTCSGRWPQIEDAAGGSTLIMTGDRDMYQCVGERVSVLYLKSGTTGFEEVDPAEVKRRYGIRPALVPDFIALRGDPSDGLPGAPGIGPKTAAELLGRHGSLEGAIAAAAPSARAYGGRAARQRRRAAGLSRTSPRCGSSSWSARRTGVPTSTAGPRRRGASG